MSKYGMQLKNIMKKHIESIYDETIEDINDFIDNNIPSTKKF